MTEFVELADLLLPEHSGHLRPSAQKELEHLIATVTGVSECKAKQRKREEWIIVPEVFLDRGRNKNLLTVWLGKDAVVAGIFSAKKVLWKSRSETDWKNHMNVKLSELR